MGRLGLLFIAAIGAIAISVATAVVTPHVQAWIAGCEAAQLHLAEGVQPIEPQWWATANKFPASAITEVNLSIRPTTRTTPEAATTGLDPCPTESSWVEAPRSTSC
ncbi:hypothetical protein Lfu02_77680 [Longispora fulva]|nr:hypothetical protein Lfu02_77680 [Longispora fulva]